MVYDNLFTADGWPNWKAIVDIGCTINLILGGRGTGKTFSCLDYELEHDRRFCFMRKNQVQLDMVMAPENSPFIPLNLEKGYDVELKKRGKISRIFNGNKDVGFMVALAAVSGLRGFDASLIQDIIYDEFIHERHEKPMRGEFEALLNAYETMNRNRELQGREPIKLYLLANSNSLDSDILLGFKLVEIIRKMRRKGRTVYIDKKRSILIVDLFSSPISQKKKETALYKAVEGSDFYGMAIKNEFSYDRTDKVKAMPLNEYILEIRVGEINIYKHKSRKEYYVSSTQKGTPKEIINPVGEGRKRLLRKYMKYYKYHVDNKVLFENMTSKILFEKYYLG